LRSSNAIREKGENTKCAYEVTSVGCAKILSSADAKMPLLEKEHYDDMYSEILSHWDN